MAIKKNDKVFLAIVFALFFFGFFVLSSASLGLVARDDQNHYFLLAKQILLGGGLGFGLFLITSRIHYKHWKKFALPLLLLGFAITLLVFEPRLGLEHGGAKRWLSLGLISFQPAELLKFTFIIYLSSWLYKQQKEIRSFKTGLLPLLIILGLVSAIMILQPDIGTLGVMTIAAVILFFLAGARLSQIAALFLIGLLALSALAFTKPYLMNRLNVFFDTSYDLQGAGYQLNQTKIAMGSGGIWGKGFGKGTAKFGHLPEPTGDSIFAVVGEEFGFGGTTLLVFLLLAFFYKSIYIATKAPDQFGRLLVSGIAILIIVQSFINMYAVVGLIPLTGLPLIFISQGGSALAFTMAEVGIIYNVSKYRK